MAPPVVFSSEGVCEVGINEGAVVATTGVPTRSPMCFVRLVVPWDPNTANFDLSRLTGVGSEGCSFRVLVGLGVIAIAVPSYTVKGVVFRGMHVKKRPSVTTTSS